MSDVNLAGVDLNLLVVVDAVLETCSATRAAARLHVTQSAVSNALRRARELFGDPLVVRSGHGFVRTPTGEALAPRLRAVLGEVGDLLEQRTAFDASTCGRRFTVACTDAISIVVIPRLLPLFEAALPRASLRVVSLDHLAATGGLERADVDVLIGAPPLTPAGCEEQLLFEDEYMAVVRADHPQVGRRLSLDRYAGLAHAELALFGEPEDRVGRALAAVGRARRIVVCVPHIAALPALVLASDCVATLTRTMARSFAAIARVRMLSLPIELPALSVRQIWHHRTHGDPGAVLLRQLVTRATARLGS